MSIMKMFMSLICLFSLSVFNCIGQEQKEKFELEDDVFYMKQDTLNLKNHNSTTDLDFSYKMLVDNFGKGFKTKKRSKNSFVLNNQEGIEVFFAGQRCRKRKAYIFGLLISRSESKDEIDVIIENVSMFDASRNEVEDHPYFKGLRIEEDWCRNPSRYFCIVTETGMHVEVKFKNDRVEEVFYYFHFKE